MIFITFMTSAQGRMMRVIAGGILVSLGLVVLKDTLGTVVALIALVPIAGGVFDFCLAGVMMGYPFRGAKARELLAHEQHTNQ
ncbi:MAG: DUF2892 domain-containing protein [Anaerolineaceae bacterium]|nr:DUF2892 domain-containing protein [Anaerolineaceae bacterium]